MFTGLIQEVGRITRIEQTGANRRITVTVEQAARELKIGDSIAVSGVCLTAVDVGMGTFSADLAAETWVRTSFSRLREGARVNLELPLAANARLGGHMVQGHVDGTGTFLGLEPIPEAQDFWLHIEAPVELAKYLVFKGSVAIEGISLTLARVEGNRITIAIIPHTCEMTNLQSLQPGDPVNIETDIIAKYLEKWSSETTGVRSQKSEVERLDAGFQGSSFASSLTKVERPEKPPELPYVVTGSLDAHGKHFGIVVSRFNAFITERLLQGALDALRRSGASDGDIEIVRVPGAWEIPSAARLLAKTGQVDAVICLGCLIRGETLHYEVIANEVGRGIGQSAQDTNVPHAFGVLTCNTLEQALDRAGLKLGNKGFDAALAAIEMANLHRSKLTAD
jgi:riboflavin synthase alpha subunit/6,7-dimethyl-8-ribityllumazine synthase